MQPTVIGFPRKAYVYKLMSILYNGTSYETVAFIELKFSEYTIGIKQTSKLLNLCFWGRLRVFGLGYVFLYRPTCFWGAIWLCRMHWIWATCFRVGYVFLYRPTCFWGAIWWCRMHWIWATCFWIGLRVFVSAYVFWGCYLVVQDALNLGYVFWGWVTCFCIGLHVFGVLFGGVGCTKWHLWTCYR